MSDEQEYLDRIEQHELMKKEGIDAWANAVSNALPDLEEDQRILIQQGLRALLNGLPSLLLRRHPPARIDGIYRLIFEEQDEKNGITRC
jgi:hypothetical protein